ncbi:unnamed protein product [Caenorhabditis auriculariae]|uniref:FHA domain-containing protein n=1 Tax=Caenorhabditis auriculariae TaxID=2777116 RepID=A0A8S1HM34_9PELO|nr:unnamed protein product [Caenorhabditis auriculariae]
MHGPLVVLAPIAKSHPFEERRAKVGTEEDPLKIGRAVARIKAAKDNAIFDCKVLSRNHAVMWYKEGEFFLRDTKSSNGTFVNNERLTGDENEARQIFSGDIVQFGVEIIENTNKLAHGCIYAIAQLFDADGKLVENTPTLNHSDEAYNYGSSMVSNNHLFQMQLYITEAMHREKVREEKMSELIKIIEQSEHAADSAWKALVNEDRLLARIEALEAQLAAFSKSSTPDKQREELLAMIDEKARFEAITKESIRRLYEEKCETISRLSDTERSLVSTEDTCNFLRKTKEAMDEKLRDMSELYDKKAAEYESLAIQTAEAERCLAMADERFQTTQQDLLQAQKERDAPRSAGSHLRSLVDIFHNGAELEQEDVELLLNLAAVAKPHVEETPLVNGIVKKEEEEDSNKENVMALKLESESYLKETLELQARVRDLEAQLTLALQKKQNNENAADGDGSLDLEIAPADTVSWAPTPEFVATKKDFFDRSISAKAVYRDSLAQTIFMFSIAPLLALILSFIVPLHSRFCKTTRRNHARFRTHILLGNILTRRSGRFFEEALGDYSTVQEAT